MSRRTLLSHFAASSLHTVVGQPDLAEVKSTQLESHIRSIFAKSTINIQPVTLPIDEEGAAPLKLFDCRRFRSPRQLRASQIEKIKNELVTCCLSHVQDSYRVHLNRLKGLELLDLVMSKTSVDRINSELAVHMVWACLSCIHHFLLRVKAKTGLMHWIRRRQARKSVLTYDKLIAYLAPSFYSVILNAIISFYEEANLWDVEYYSTNLLQRLLLQSEESVAVSIHGLLTLIENTTLTNPSTARQILQVLFDVEENLNWTLMDQPIIDRFVDMYYKSVTPENNPDYNYEPLEKGLDTCLRAMTMRFEEKQLMTTIQWMLEMSTLEEISDENLLTFGSLLEHVTSQLNVRNQSRLLPEAVFPLTLKLIGSDNLLYSLMGHRILHNLIDRCSNKLQFDTPMIFFKSSHYNIVLHPYNVQDKEFFQRHREVMHSIFLQSVIKHGMHKVHLENLYISIVLFLVEIPCGYTAAAAVCLSVAIQEATLESKKLQLTHAHRLHATVISIMSLVCYLHQADVFYDYVNTIVQRRAAIAPHLNPPLKLNYKYAQHHVLWNKPELFFEDWEARYGLWRCFKTKNKELMVAHSVKS